MISIFVTLIFLGVGLYLVDMIPMEIWIKRIITVLAILFTVLWLLSVFGIYHFPLKLK